jgi:hypothetical protein
MHRQLERIKTSRRKIALADPELLSNLKTELFLHFRILCINKRKQSGGNERSHRYFQKKIRTVLKGIIFLIRMENGLQLTSGWMATFQPHFSF